MSTLTIDPGQDMGWAVLDRDGGVLYGGVEVIKKERDFLYKTRIFVQELAEAAEADLVIVEWPKIRAQGAADPNRIMSLAGRAAAAAASHPNVRVYLPEEWTRRVSKDVRHRRLLYKEPELLDERFLGSMSKHHNYLDAVGLGRYALRDLGLLRR